MYDWDVRHVLTSYLHLLGMSCRGSKFGSCCSKWGYCGSDKGYCGEGCQPG
ncbi:hypothetical protein CC86DRAFT_295190, partial [Ophiobolus disseminans]